jgi:hypothetical protein
MSGALHQGLVEHASLDKAFHALIEAADNAGDVAGTFHVLADRLRHHMGSEDLDIARFADVDAAEAKALLRDHEEFRGILDGFAAQLQAGTLAAKELHAFRMRFLLHEAREETGLYRWVAAR